MPLSSRALREWVNEGHPGTLATSSADGRPHIVRVWAARPAGDNTLELYVVRSAARAVVRDLPAAAAVSFASPKDYRSIQIKGTCELISTPAPKAFIDARVAGLDRLFQTVGLRAGDAFRMLHCNSNPEDFLGIRMTAEVAFDQSPGPGAGSAL